MFAHIFASPSSYSLALIRLLGTHSLGRKNDYLIGIGNSKFTLSSEVKNEFGIKNLYNPLVFIKFIKDLKKYNRIIIHYLPYDPSLFFWFLMRSYLKKKGTWVFWGNDVYSFSREKESLRTRVYEKLRRKIILNFNEIAGFVKEDYEVLKKVYFINSSYKEVLYPLPFSTNNLDKIKINRNNNGFRILIGNSADPANNHIEAFKMVSRFIDREKKIVSFLSYGGTKEYIDLVISKGVELFGDNFTPIRGLLNPDEFILKLSEFDMAIMNHDRQQAMGNILTLVYLGIPVFMRKELSSFVFFKRNEVPVNDISALKLLEEENINMFAFDKTLAQEKIRNLISDETYVKKWNDLLKAYL